MLYCAPTDARGKPWSSRASVAHDPRRLVAASQAFADSAATRLAAIVTQLIAQRGRARIALAGGSTPRAVYRRWAEAAATAWDRLEFFFGDERCVDPTDPASNYRMAREALFDLVSISPQQIHRMPAEHRDRDAAAAQYAARLPPRLDLIILGIGEDGHTASLFPGSSALNEQRRLVLAVKAPKAPYDRLTITPPVLRAAREKIVLAGGTQKAAAVRQALQDQNTPMDCPARLARDGIWIMDHAAAAELRDQK